MRLSYAGRTAGKELPPAGMKEHELAEPIEAMRDDPEACGEPGGAGTQAEVRAPTAPRDSWLGDRNAQATRDDGHRCYLGQAYQHAMPLLVRP